MSRHDKELMMKTDIQKFIAAVCDKKGLRFAVELHHALAEGRLDQDTRLKLQAAIRALA